MIKEIICVDIGKTIYVVSTDKDEYYYISTKQRKIVKGCLAELTKVGYWLENEDHSDYLLKLLEDILKYPDHDAFHHFTQKLNEIYLKYPALYEMDYDLKGFEWLVVDDHDQCVFAIERKDKEGNAIIAVMNFVGNTHEKYKVPVNIEGSYKEILNTDQAVYSGKNIINPRAIRSKKTKPNKKTKLLNKDHYIEVKLAPFSACIFEVKPKKETTKETLKKTKRVTKKTK